MAKKNPINMGVKAVTTLHDQIKQMEKQSENVVKKTVNDFKTRAPAWVNASVSEVYNIKKGDVKADYKGAIKISVSNKVISKDKLIENVGLKYEGRVRTLRGFGMKPTQPPKKQEKDFKRIPGQGTPNGNEVAMVKPLVPYQLTFEIFKGQRVTANGNVFIGSNNGSGFIPFIRTGKNRLDIRSLTTASTPSMIGNEKVKLLIMDKLEEGLGKRLEHHLQQELKKRN